MFLYVCFQRAALLFASYKSDGYLSSNFLQLWHKAHSMPCICLWSLSRPLGLGGRGTSVILLMLMIAVLWAINCLFDPLGLIVYFQHLQCSRWCALPSSVILGLFPNNKYSKNLFGRSIDLSVLQKLHKTISNLFIYLFIYLIVYFPRRVGILEFI